MTLYDDIMQHLAPPAAMPPVTVDLNPLVRMIQQWDLRASWAALVHEYYPQADYVSADLSSEYNDEGGYYNVINHITVYNAAGEDISDTITEERQEDFNDARWELPVPESFPEADRIDLRLSRPLTNYSRDYLLLQLSKAHDALVALPESCFGPSL
jgi:hypothetical protein